MFVKENPDRKKNHPLTRLGLTIFPTHFKMTYSEETYSEPNQTSEMELFAKIVNGF